MLNARSRLRGILAGGIARGAMASLGLRITSVTLAFLSAIILARILGPAGFGIYGFSLAVAEIMLIASTLGIPNLLRKEIPVAMHHCKNIYVRDLLRHSFAIVFAAAALTGAAVYLIALASPDFLEQGSLLPLGLALVMLPFHALALTGQGASAGLGQVVFGQIPLSIIRPGVILGILLCAYLLAIPLNPAEAVAITLLSTLVTLGFALRLVLRNMPDYQPSESSPEISLRPLLKAGLPFTLIAGFGVLNNQADVVMLGILTSAEETGFYRVAQRIASTAAFPYMALIMPLAPAVAAMFARGDIAGLRYRSVMASRYAFAGAAAISTVLIVFSDFVLRLFGDSFRSADTTLLLLCGGQLVITGLFAIQTVLAMTGHEKIVARNLAAGAILNISLNFALIPSFGMEGAAFASLFSSLLLGIALLIQSRQSLGFAPAFFSRTRQTAE